MCLEKINRPCHIYQYTKSFENLVKNLKVNMNAVIICEYFLSVKLIHKRLKYKTIRRPLLRFMYDCLLLNEQKPQKCVN